MLVLGMAGIVISMTGFITTLVEWWRLRREAAMLQSACLCTCPRCSAAASAHDCGQITCNRPPGGGGSSITASGSGGGGSTTFAGGGWISGSAGGGSYVTPGSSISYGSSGIIAASGGSGGGGGSMAVGGPLPGPRGSGAGMTGFAETGSQDFDFAVGAVRGLRQWSMAAPDLRSDPHQADRNWPVTPLHGATGFAWPAGVLEAQCNNGFTHPVPAEYIDDHHPDLVAQRCGCGVWAYWDTGALAVNRFSTASGSWTILGMIEGHGRVLLGTRGFRSQRARIVALAPAFTIQAQLPQRLYAPLYFAGIATAALEDGRERRQQGEEENEQALREHVQQRAQQHADAWMAVIMDRLGQLYPGAAVYATVGGLLACERTEGKPQDP